MRGLPVLLSLQAAAFAAASLVHSGRLLDGYGHRQAMIAEAVIAAVLVLGLVAGFGAPRWARAAALAAQGFALLGTIVGLLMIAIGVGPQTAFDLVIHAGFVTLLVAGLVIVARHGREVAA